LEIKRENARKNAREREKERETASIDVFSRQIVYQQKKREREREKHPLI